MPVTWSFYMERYCGFLKRALRSRSQPWRNLDERIKHFAYITQIRMRFNLQHDLDLLIEDPANDSEDEDIFQVSSVERIIPSCRCRIVSCWSNDVDAPIDPMSALRRPYRSSFQPDPNLRNAVALYLRIFIRRSQKHIANHLPALIPSWGGVRILPYGDTVRCGSLGSRRPRADERNASFVRVSLGTSMCMMLA